MPVRQLRQVLRVAPAACHACRRAGQQPVAEPACQVPVHEALARHTQRYGTPRQQAEVRTHGTPGMGRWRIRRIRRVRKAHGLRVAALIVHAAHHGIGPGCVRGPELLARPANPHRPEPGLDG